MKDEIQRNATIKELENLVTEIKKITAMERKRRPIVIEFAGSPKSGKTSCINSLALFLKRNSVKTVVLTEKASICPIKDKQSPLFNIWTFNAMLNELNAAYDAKGIDIIICDRSFFDAICWFKWMISRKILDRSNFNTLYNYVTYEKWIGRIDLVYVFIATPDISIEREYANLLTNKMGSIMNKTVLSQYNLAINDAINEHGDVFKKIEMIDTSKKDQNMVSKEVTTKVLEKLKDVLEEKIAYIPKEKYKDIFSSEITSNKEKITNIKIYEEDSIKKSDINFLGRDEVEKNTNYIQILPIGVLTNSNHDKVLILKKQASAAKDSPEKDSYMIWAGGHAREEDFDRTCDFIGLAKNTLKREIEEELGISIALDNIIPYYIYSTIPEKSSQHLAICFLIERDLEGLKLNLDPYELVQHKGKSKSGEFLFLKDIKELTPIEPWSKIILETIFNIDFKGQLKLTT
ncbi:MAG: hypothetical protein ACRCSK_06935 [Fusobacteriaceae bacterium]